MNLYCREKLPILLKYVIIASSMCIFGIYSRDKGFFSSWRIRFGVTDDKYLANCDDNGGIFYRGEI